VNLVVNFQIKAKAGALKGSFKPFTVSSGVLRAPKVIESESLFVEQCFGVLHLWQGEQIMSRNESAAHDVSEI